MPPHGWLPADLLLYGELLVCLSGVFLYGFVARQLFANPSLLPGNRALRLAVACVTVWYGGCLLDEVAAILVGGRLPGGTVLDVVRAGAWLVGFPAFAQASWRFASEGSEVAGRRGVPRVFVALSYATLGLFIWPAVEYWGRAETSLETAAADLYPRIVIHAAVGGLTAFVLLLSALRRGSDPRLVLFLRSLLVALAAVVGVVALGVLSFGLGDVWRVSAQLVGLGPAAVLLWFAQRHSLLRLSLSLRTLRHFLTTVAVVLLVVAAGPAVRAEGAEGSDVFRRLVALTVLLAFIGGSAYSAVAARVARRWPAIRRLIQPSIPARETEELVRRLRTLEADEPELKAMVTAGLERSLGMPARFLGGREEGSGGVERLWKYFLDSPTPGCDRVDAPPELARVLADEGLYAAFPVRVAEELVDILVVEPGPGGGVREGERETVQLVIGQLSAVLELRRLAEDRLATERRLAEQERLGTLGLVAASLAHEVKNPLASIKALAQTVQEELAASDGGAEQREDLNVIVGQIGRLEEVTREILGFARPTGDDRTDLAGLVRSAIYVLRSEARRRGIEIEAHGLDESGAVPGSPATWQVAVFNLILNAVRHAPAGSTVVVRLIHREGRVVAFETENGGPAIDEALASRIFEPFVSRDGTGLGLAMAARSVAAAGGTIGLVNEPDRVVFRVELGATT
jgi:signal transduction histidine kinase